MTEGGISRPTTPDVSEMTIDKSMALLQTTRLGRIFASLITTGSNENNSVSLATMASRIGMITQEEEDRETRIRAREDELSARAKFTGAQNGPAKGELDVVGLLESMTRGQAHMKLSLDEFLNVFISACASTPQTMLVEQSKLITEGQMTIAELYLQFSDCYFFDLRPDQAMAKLKAFKGKNTFSSLADADVTIRKLAQLASLGEETQERRNLFFQKYYRKTLLAVIPDKYISVILQQIERKKTLSGKELSPSDLLGICRAFRVEIDTFFFKKTQNASQKQEGSTNQASGKKGRKKQKGEVKAVTRSQKDSDADKPSPKPNGNGGAIPKNGNGNGNNGNNGKNGTKDNGHANGNGNGNGKPNHKNGNGNGQKNGYKPNHNKPLHLNECKLRLQTNHSFDCCPLFKQHERVVSDHTCPCALRAFHLERYCPISKSKN